MYYIGLDDQGYKLSIQYYNIIMKTYKKNIFQNLRIQCKDLLNCTIHGGVIKKCEY